jgi:hypothetical protein
MMPIEYATEKNLIVFSLVFDCSHKSFTFASVVRISTDCWKLHLPKKGIEMEFKPQRPRRNPLCGLRGLCGSAILSWLNKICGRGMPVDFTSYQIGFVICKSA